MRIASINGYLRRLVSDYSDYVITSKKNKNIDESLETIDKLKGLHKLITITISISDSMALTFQELADQQNEFLHELEDNSRYCKDILQQGCNAWYGLIMKRKRRHLIQALIRMQAGSLSGTQMAFTQHFSR